MAETPATSHPAGDRDGDEVLHVIVRAEDDGSFYSVRSPQVPGLAYGAASLEEVHAGLTDVLEFALDRAGPFQIVEHHERRFDTAGREVVVRLAVDRHYPQRQEAYARLARAVSVPEQVDALLDAPADVVGEVLYVCAVPADEVSWIAAQLDPGGAATLAVTVADMMRTSPIMRPAVNSLAVS